MQVITRVIPKNNSTLAGITNFKSLVLAQQQNTHAQDCEKLSCKTSPPGPFNEVWQVVEKTECVEGIASDLSHSPRDQKKHHTLLILDLQNDREIHSVV